MFAGGVAWLVGDLPSHAQNAIAAGVLPFMIGDGIKCALAAGVAPVWPKIAARLGLLSDPGAVAGEVDPHEESVLAAGRDLAQVCGGIVHDADLIRGS